MLWGCSWSLWSLHTLIFLSDPLNNMFLFVTSVQTGFSWPRIESSSSRASRHQTWDRNEKSWMMTGVWRRIFTVPVWTRLQTPLARVTIRGGCIRGFRLFKPMLLLIQQYCIINKATCTIDFTNAYQPTQLISKLVSWAPLNYQSLKVRYRTFEMGVSWLVVIMKFQWNPALLC